MNTSAANYRSLSEILTDVKDELQEFALTRVELFRNEVRERVEIVKATIPLAAAGVLFLATAFVLFSFALVGLLVVAFGDNPYRWFLGALIVGVLWSLIGALAAFLARQRLASQSWMPEKTMRVLNGDRVWLRQETKSAL